MRAVHSDLEADGGAQPQRTVLAWNRTILAAVVGTAIVSVNAQRQQLPAVAALAALVCVVLLVLLLRDLPRWREGGGTAHYRLMRHVTGAVVVLAVLGVVVAVAGISR